MREYFGLIYFHLLFMIRKTCLMLALTLVPFSSFAEEPRVWCFQPQFDTMYPPMNAKVAEVDQIGFTASVGTDIESISVEVGSSEVPAAFVIKPNGDIFVEADLETPLDELGRVKVELYAVKKDGTGRGFTYYVEVVAPNEVNTQVDPGFVEHFSDPSFDHIFNDTEGHWSEYKVERLGQLGIVSGKGDGSYGVDDFITRAEVVGIALKGFGYGVPDTASSSPFLDVDQNNWYAPFVETAHELGIANGFENDLFYPNATITKAEALKMILTAAGIDVYEGAEDRETSFGDSPEDAWHNPYVTWAHENGVANGKTATFFGANNEVTKAEVAKMQYEILEYLGAFCNI